MIRFDYQEPTTLKKAFGLIEKHGEDARVIAGGTSLIIMMRQRLLMPKVVISLGRIPKFDRIAYNSKEGLRIGAGARHRDIELSAPIKKHYPLLHETFRKVAQPRIRNMGTVGGNLAAGDPLTDPGASLIALDAEVTLTSSKGRRRLRLDEFFIDYYQTALEPGELLTEIHVPPPQRPGWAHIKFTPRSMEDFATVGVAITLKAANGTCEDIRIIYVSVLTPSRPPSCEPEKPKTSCAVNRLRTPLCGKRAKPRPRNAIPPTTTVAPLDTRSTW
jgi:aerobic carbon-monoxide dehydrogenase medium subunit